MTTQKTPLNIPLFPTKSIFDTIRETQEAAKTKRDLINAAVDQKKAG